MKPPLRPGQRRPLLPGRIRSVLFWLHLAVGLAAGIVIFIMSVTGALLMYERQITEWADQRYRSALPPGGPHLPVEALITSVSESSGAVPSSLTLQADPAIPAAVSLGRERTVYLDPATGVVLGEGSRGTRLFFRKITDWHRWLGAEGKKRDLFRGLTGACNLAFLILILSGPFLWLPKQWTWRQVKNVSWFRRGLAGKARDFNWHNVIGLWTAAILFLVVLTGVVMSYPWANALLFRLAGDTPPPARGEGGPRERGRGAEAAQAAMNPENLEGLDELWAVAERQVPGWKSLSLRLPTDADAPVTFTIAKGDRGRPDLRAQLTLRRTGEIEKWEPFSAQSPGRRLRSWGRWVHTGEAGGFLGQTLAGLASAGAAVLVWTGFALSWRRFFPRRRTQVEALEATKSSDFLGESL